MSFLKSKKFWLTVLHIGTGLASATAIIMFPGILPFILPLQAVINGVLPSPIATSKVSATNLNLPASEIPVVKKIN